MGLGGVDGWLGEGGGRVKGRVDGVEGVVYLG